MVGDVTDGRGMKCGGGGHACDWWEGDVIGRKM